MAVFNFYFYFFKKNVKINIINFKIKNLKKIQKTKKHIIGGGIAWLSAAVYLIQDGNIDWKNITIYDKAKRFWGCLDAKKTKDWKWYTMRWVRAFEKWTYTAFMDLISRIPSKKAKYKTLEEEFLDYNKNKRSFFNWRLTKKKKIINWKKLKLTNNDRIKLLKLLFTNESKIDNVKIKDYFEKTIFKSNFWYEFCTLFAFKKEDSLIEMKRYLLRFCNSFEYIDTLEVLQVTPVNQYEFLVLPIIEYLKEKWVKFTVNIRITNFSFKKHNNKKYINDIQYFKNWKTWNILVNKNDKVFVTLWSMKDSSSIWNMKDIPKDKTDKAKLPWSWDLWEKIAKNNKSFWNPKVFTKDTKKTWWTSFTVTFKKDVMEKLMKAYIEDKHTAFSWTTIVDSGWFITILFHLDNYFINQDDNTIVAWGYVLSPEKKWNFIKKKIKDCNWKEIMEELIYQLWWEKNKDKILKNSVCIPDYTPYVTSQFVATKKWDKPEVVPWESWNFAFLWQFVEIKDDVVFTVDYSIRTAQKAVYELLKINKNYTKIPNFLFNPKVIYNFIKTSFR